MICDPSVNGKEIRHAEQFRKSIATLHFTVPQTAKGKVLKVNLTFKNGGQLASTVAASAWADPSGSCPPTGGA